MKGEKKSMAYPNLPGFFLPGRVPSCLLKEWSDMLSGCGIRARQSY
jgi:hypothetical protein